MKAGSPNRLRITQVVSGISLERLRVNTFVPQSIIKQVSSRRYAIVITDESEIVSTEMTYFPFADPLTHSFQLRIDLPQIELELLPGMFVKVALEVSREDKTVIPFNAVAFRGEVTGIYVLEDQKLHFRHVRLGRRLADNEVVVLAGVFSHIVVAFLIYFVVFTAIGVGKGCYIDQVIGQWWAHQLDLGWVYPPDRVRTALQSLVKYNFRGRMEGLKQVPRKFVADNDPGMQMITWPKGPRPPKVIRYGDEVMTGFRVAWGGAQVLYDVKPDLACFGKVVGGGLPAAAYGGRAELMTQMAPEGPVYQAGTLSGNPLAVAAGVAGRFRFTGDRKSVV